MTHLHHRLLLVIALWLPAEQVSAVAYCALRDPVTTIYELFPEANSYRSSVRTVGREARAQIIERVTIALHFNELGRHTLYIAQQDERPIGFVHARSELGKWGLIEFAFAIGLDQTLHSAKIQRARATRLLSPNVLKPYLDEIIGFSEAELKEKLVALHDSSDPLYKTLLQSAVKTLAITDLVWADEVQMGWAHHAAQSLGNHQKITAIEPLFSDHTINLLDTAGLRVSAAFDRAQIQAFQVLDHQGDSMGTIAHTLIDSIQPGLRLWWSAATDGEVVAIQSPTRQTIPAELLATINFNPREARNCSGLAELAALEIAVLARQK